MRQKPYPLSARYRYAHDLSSVNHARGGFAPHAGIGAVVKRVRVASKRDKRALVAYDWDTKEIDTMTRARAAGSTSFTLEDVEIIERRHVQMTVDCLAFAAVGEVATVDVIVSFANRRPQGRVTLVRASAEENAPYRVRGSAESWLTPALLEDLIASVRNPTDYAYLLEMIAIAATFVATAYVAQTLPVVESAEVAS